jgi:tetratricopeptide (TPR) repeat protein
MELKEYKMAMRDLNEALKWSTANKMPALEAVVQQNYAYLYNRQKDYDKGDAALKRANRNSRSSIQRSTKIENLVIITFDNSPQKIKSLP